MRQWLRRLFTRRIVVALLPPLPVQEQTAMQLDMVAEWLEDRARLLRGFDDFGSLELAISAEAVRNRQMLPGGIIGCPGQPYPTNGGTPIG